MKPTCEKHSDGTEEWRLNGYLHREDGPAYIDSDGTEYWYLNGLRHREDGPAHTRPNGHEEWWLNNVLVEPFTQEQLPLILLGLTEL